MIFPAVGDRLPASAGQAGRQAGAAFPRIAPGVETEASALRAFRDSRGEGAGRNRAEKPHPPAPDRRSVGGGNIKHSYSSQTLQKAQALRQTRTDAEGLLWHFLRNKQLDGYKFRRQQPIGSYIADFACLPRKLLIELDGGQHLD